MSSEKTKTVATYVLGGFSAAAALALILWAVGILKVPDKNDSTPGVDRPLGGSIGATLEGE